MHGRCRPNRHSVSGTRRRGHWQVDRATIRVVGYGWLHRHRHRDRLEQPWPRGRRRAGAFLAGLVVSESEFEAGQEFVRYVLRRLGVSSRETESLIGRRRATFYQQERDGGLFQEK